MGNIIKTPRFWKTKALFGFMAGIFSILVLGLNASAAVTETVGGATSNNLHKHEYTWYAMTIPKSFLYLRDNGYARVEALDDKVIVEQYSADYVLNSSKEFTYELPLFGGFFHGANYNYLVFGQNNPQDSDSVEVMRIVKYDLNWNRLGSVSYYGCNTYAPFDAGSMSIAEYGDVLYIRTCHEMYKSNDGYHHQACMTFTLKQSDLSEIDKYVIVMNVSVGYVSHSFNQYIRIVGDKAVAVDHGDAYPRSIVLGQYSEKADTGNVSTYGGYSYVNLLSIPGELGENYTGVNVGGFEVSSSHYLVAVNSVNLNQLETALVKNVQLLIQPLGNFENNSTVVRNFTSYAEDGNTSVSNPYLVPMEDDEFALIWEEMSRPSNIYYGGSSYGRVMIQKIDHEGKPIGEVKQVEGYLSDCAPIYADGKIIWYVTKGKAPIFYEIPVTEQDNRLSLSFRHNVEFDNNIAMHYVVPKSELEGYSNLKLIIDKEEYAENVATPAIRQYVLENPATYWIKDSNNVDVEYWHFTFPGIFASEMGNVLNAKLQCEKAGVTYESQTDECSVKEYAYGRLDKTKKESYRKLLVDMLNYGTAAQTHFGKNAANPVNADLTNDQKKLGSTLEGFGVGSVENVIALNGTATASFDAKNLVFDTNIVLAYRLDFSNFKKNAPADTKEEDKMANVKVVFRYNNGKGEKTFTVPYSKFTKSKGKYVASCSVLTPSEMGCTVNATIYDGDEPVSDTLQYSIESYVHNRLDPLTGSGSETYKDLVKKMVLYGRTVKAHFSN